MKNNFLLILIVSAVFVFKSLAVFAQDAASQTEIIFDASGSMNEAKNGVVKLDMAKDALKTLAGQIPEGSNVGLRIFGAHPVTAQGNVKTSCEDSQLVMPIAPFHQEKMIQQVAAVESHGMTAIGYSLELAGKDFSASETSPGGPFTVVGTFETTNLVFPKNPVQEYTFEKLVKAKYLKIKFVSNHGGNSCYAYEILAMGSLD